MSSSSRLKKQTQDYFICTWQSQEHVRWAHDADILFIQQVHTAKQAHQAAELGVDALIAQGCESGGFAPM
jgi:NAD(P)H-dependent flavin oxidoreductase YrpB (nitropropane dioxygenase family)